MVVAFGGLLACDVLMNAIEGVAVAVVVVCCLLLLLLRLLNCVRRLKVYYVKCNFACATKENYERRLFLLL